MNFFSQLSSEEIVGKYELQEKHGLYKVGNGVSDWLKKESTQPIMQPFYETGFPLVSS